MSENGSFVAEPIVRRDSKQDQEQKRQPRYHVILWDDDDHSYEYVIMMMRWFARLRWQPWVQLVTSQAFPQS